ncbi:efflux RND transporter periplasmic adaptor subunit [Cryomorpha ignava]|uniref:Efflux RND transporter periplasmic adaptor subunit n=1 Tax=Cryomorpha ignava TaxID=101383 RepID=A0A7K3WQ42_9FLAO|nr:efflux RND transporter periplasmic adaptor subunit [Cryomorpha ignava]NEN23141.1 efflux RND transporter periplasmic adaptor subunit [Cryomorpha ignava]
MKSIKLNGLFTTGIFLIAIFIVVSCDNQPDTKLTALVAERDSLKTERKELDDKIHELDEQIQELDSTITNKLVTTITADTALFKHYFDVYGNVQSDKTASLFAENPGNVTQILVEEGQQVKKGQLLVRVDDDVYSSNLQELQTSLDLATTLFNKQKRLWDQNIGSEVQYLEAKNRKESLENSIATLREQKSKSSVVAPFDGVVDKIFPKVGEMASMQMPVARIVNLDDMYITADVSERYINTLKVGDEVSLRINEDTITSKITRVGAFINATNRSFEIRVAVDDKVDGIRPNSLVAMKINDMSKKGAIVLPSSIIMQDGKGKDYVYVIGKDDKAKQVALKKSIQTGASYEGKTVVLEGINPGDKVIEKGARSVRDSDRVDTATI